MLLPLPLIFFSFIPFLVYVFFLSTLDDDFYVVPVARTRTISGDLAAGAGARVGTSEATRGPPPFPLNFRLDCDEADGGGSRDNSNSKKIRSIAEVNVAANCYMAKKEKEKKNPKCSDQEKKGVVPTLTQMDSSDARILFDEWPLSVSVPGGFFFPAVLATRKERIGRGEVIYTARI